MYQWLAKNYDNVASISVKENKGVGNIKFVSTWVDWTSVIVSWESVWDSPRYRVSYGTDKNSLTKDCGCKFYWGINRKFTSRDNLLLSSFSIRWRVSLFWRAI